MLFALLLAQMTPAVELTCGGAGYAINADTETVYGADNAGNSAWPTVRGERREAFEDRVDVRLSGDGGWIRLPQTMLDGRDAGWHRLKIRGAADGKISGSAAVDVLNNPQVLIDRAAGTIRVSGALGAFQGSCQAAG